MGQVHSRERMREWHRRMNERRIHAVSTGWKPGKKDYVPFTPKGQLERPRVPRVSEEERLAAMGPVSEEWTVPSITGPVEARFEWMDRPDGLNFIPPEPAPWIQSVHLERQRMHHYIHRHLLGGLHVAPLVDPTSILDVGSGVGTWITEMARAYPRAQCVGVDVEAVPQPPDAPENCFFTVCDATRRFPFQDNSFSYVFLRFFTLSVPMGGWEAFLAECLRILEPGGYIEVHGSDYLMRRCGEYGERLNGAVEEMSRLVGVDLADARSLQRPLAIAGFEEVGRRVSSLPMGTWGGRLGEWSLEATRLHIETTALPLMQRFLSPDRIEGLEGSTLGFFFETDDYRSYVNLYAYLGRKPIGEISPGSSLCG